VITEDETELILPSGVRLGHRALNRYYKQKFRPPEVRARSGCPGVGARRVAHTQRMHGRRCVRRGAG